MTSRLMITKMPDISIRDSIIIGTPLSRNIRGALYKSEAELGCPAHGDKTLMPPPNFTKIPTSKKSSLRIRLSLYVSADALCNYNLLY